MPHAAPATKQNSVPPEPLTIDALAGASRSLETQLAGSEKIPARTLRAVWAGRLRPFWRLRPGLYRSLSRRFLDQGDAFQASEVAEEGLRWFEQDAALIFNLALAWARSGSPQAAQELLTAHETVLLGTLEAKSLLARTYKDLWKNSGETQYLQKAFDFYLLDYQTTSGDRFFPGVNAASMAFFLDRTNEARRLAEEVRAMIESRPSSCSYWAEVSRAECLLIEQQIEPARAAYAAAAVGDAVPWAHLATTRSQARLLLRQAGRSEHEFDTCFPMPSVIACTGHRIDADGRTSPRFPETLVKTLKARIREAVKQCQAGFGYSAAADGADILFLECLQEAGRETYIHLPLPEEDFVRASVRHSGSSDWLERFRKVTAAATEYTCAPHFQEGSLAFDLGNQLMLGAARRHAQQLETDVCLLAVWNGLPGDHGGTGDCVSLAREAGFAIKVIDLPSSGMSASLPPAAPAENAQILAVVSLSLIDPGRAAHLAAVLADSKVVHREVADDRIRLFFATAADAAQAACILGRTLDGNLNGSIGLHAGIISVTRHPLTNSTVFRGEVTAYADALAALTPAGRIYASSEITSLLSLEVEAGLSTEFLGHRSLGPGWPSEPVFRLPY